MLYTPICVVGAKKQNNENSSKIYGISQGGVAVAEKGLNRFNLVHEKWIPVVNQGLASLMDVFSQPHYTALGGTPTQKISLTKLLLAITQAANILENDQDWKRLGAEKNGQKISGIFEREAGLLLAVWEKPFFKCLNRQGCQTISWCRFPKCCYGQYDRAFTITN